MKPKIRRTGLLAATLMMVVAAFWWATPAVVAGFSPEQTGPVAGSAPARTIPPKDLTLEERADLFMARKNYASAAECYSRALRESTSKAPLLWNKLGIALQQQSNFLGARRAYTNATRANKNFAEAWNNLGTVYYMEKKYGRSVKYYQRAIELMGDNAPFHMNLGTALYHQKKLELAVAEYRTALGIDPNVMTEESPLGTTVHAGGADVEFYFYMAKAFASVGNAEEAVRYLRRALEDGFNDPKRIDEDPDFKKISQHPAFVELMRNPPVAIKN